MFLSIGTVDHGKTTLVDQLLRAGSDKQISERLLDSGDLEMERGITIKSKITRIIYHDHIINCADTPGHADFSGEVDRFLSMSDGFLLVVDAGEGPKSQTKYVLSRALNLGLQPIVVFNKCDRAEAIAKIDSGETEDKVHELFHVLCHNQREVPDHTILYASAREGWVTDDPLEALDLTDTGLVDKEAHGMHNLLERIVQEIPPPLVRYYGSMDGSTPDDGTMEPTFFEHDTFSMAAVTVGNDQYLGRTCTGRILSGSLSMGDRVSVLARDGTKVGTDSQEIKGMFIYEGISKVPLEPAIAYAGDVVTLACVPTAIAVGDTLTKTEQPVSVPIVTPPLAPPTLCMDFGANDGPLAGKEGTEVTNAKVRARLLEETDNNVTLKVEPSQSDAEKTTVFARGELQLGILIETMRREGFEIIVSPPKILTKKCPKTKKTLEPYEEVTIDVDSEFTGAVINALTGDRKGVLMNMEEQAGGKTQLILEIPSRGLLGFNNEIATLTRGSAVVNHLYIGDREEQQLGYGLMNGKLVSMENGKASAYALNNLSSRGTLFVSPGDVVYNGMVVGENSKGGDQDVNASKAKEKSNMRSATKDEGIKLPPPKKMTIEELIGYMEGDEVIEITPKNVRLRKLILDNGERDRAARAKAKQRKAQKQQQKGGKK